MKSIIKLMLEDIYLKAIELAKKKEQILHKDWTNWSKGEMFITLEQLENILKEFES